MTQTDEIIKEFSKDPEWKKGFEEEKRKLDKEVLDSYIKVRYSVQVKHVVTEDGTYYDLVVPDLPGLEIYSGSLKEGFNELRGAKREWVASNIANKRSIPEPKTPIHKKLAV